MMLMQIVLLLLIQVYINTINIIITINKTDVTNLQTESSNRISEMGAINRAVANLQSENITNDNELTDIKTDITTLQTENSNRISEMSTTNSNVTNTAHIATLQTENSNRISNVSRTSSNVTTNTTNIATLQTENTDRVSEIARIKTEMANSKLIVQPTIMNLLVKKTILLIYNREFNTNFRYFSNRFKYYKRYRRYFRINTNISNFESENSDKFSDIEIINRKYW